MIPKPTSWEQKFEKALMKFACFFISFSIPSIMIWLTIQRHYNQKAMYYDTPWSIDAIAGDFFMLFLGITWFWLSGGIALLQIIFQPDPAKE